MSGRQAARGGVPVGFVGNHPFASLETVSDQRVGIPELELLGSIPAEQPPGLFDGFQTADRTDAQIGLPLFAEHLADKAVGALGQAQHCVEEVVEGLALRACAGDELALDTGDGREHLMGRRRLGIAVIRCAASVSHMLPHRGRPTRAAKSRRNLEVARYNVFNENLCMRTIKSVHCAPHHTMPPPDAEKPRPAGRGFSFWTSFRSCSAISRSDGTGVRRNVRRFEWPPERSARTRLPTRPRGRRHRRAWPRPPRH